MKIKVPAIAAAIILMAACGENRNMEAASETTGSVQAEQQTTDTLSATTTGATGGTAAAMTNEDKDFVAKAGMGGLAEVQMGNLALQKATNADVKAFAQRMVTDHGMANDELAQLATAKGLVLPTAVTGEHKDAYDHLNGLSGADFDKAYMKHMVEDHDKTVADFDKASTSATDADLKSWAGKTLPTLQDHLRQAKEVAAKV
jgi:putative membrane protein